MPSEWVGHELGDYRILEVLGRGNMAEVYKAWQPSVDRLVAVKIIAPALAEDPLFEMRFRREVKIVATLEHPHVLPVIDFGDQEGTLFLVTRYVSGGTLHDLIRKGPLGPEAVLRYLQNLGSALDYAHRLGILHRDIKPKNVLLDSQGNPVIADFGLSKMMAGVGLTHSGVGMIGTPHYMSPEQGSGQETDGRSDLYSLAVMAYEMFTGQLPFTAESAVGIVMKHIREPVPPVSEINPQLPRALDAVLERALAKDPKERYPTAAEFTSAVAAAIGHSLPGSSLPASPEAAGTAPRRLSVPTWVTGSLNWLRGPQARSALLGGAIVLALAVLFNVLTGPRGGAPSATPATTLPASPGLPATDTPPAPVTAGPSPAVSPSAPAVSTETGAPPLPSATPPSESRQVAQLDGMTLIYVPAGTFLLGSADSDLNAQEDEKPQTVIYLDAFWIDRTEVSVAQFQDFVSATGYQTDAERGCCDGSLARVGGVVFTPDQLFVKDASWRQPEGPGAPASTARQPVVQVSWNDAQAYCAWAGRRLPTEAEWDKAARGPTGLIYPWGDAFDPARLNFCDRRCGAAWHDTGADDTFARTSTVGVFPAGASPYDVLDMSGNAWEWVNDWYDFRGYYRFPTANPPGAEAGLARVVRGGSWIDTFDRVRASARGSGAVDSRNNVTGFRCALSATQFP